MAVALAIAIEECVGMPIGKWKTFELDKPAPSPLEIDELLTGVLKRRSDNDNVTFCFKAHNTILNVECRPSGEL